MSYNLFLDDDPRRIPHQLKWIELPLVEWTIVRSYKAFVDIIIKQGLPKMVSFDHDLADEHYKEFFAHRDERRPLDYSNLTEKTGRDCAVWLANYCIDNKQPIPVYYIHTLNPSGGANIVSILESAKKAML
jgi:hypothetical protein